MGEQTLKYIDKKTAISIGLITFFIIPTVTAIVFALNVKNDAEHCNEMAAENKSRIIKLELNQTQIQNNFGKMETKLDYLIQIIEELKKGIE
uniref:Uncharacterized protein n=1 Tax=viral metagenome TaxID=1070528 RepID=A0A6H1ZAX3_9ZZZZ